MTSSNEDLIEILSTLQNDISRGLLYTHTRINANTTKTLEATSFLYSLIELLNEKGILSIEELDERKKQVAQRLKEEIEESNRKVYYFMQSENILKG